MFPDVIAWTDNDAVRFLDQTGLPGAESYRTAGSIEEMVEAIQSLRVRGAPLIGIAAAMGLVAATRQQAGKGGSLSLEWLESAADCLAAARPTAVNLSWALERMRVAARAAFAADPSAGAVVATLRAEAQAIWDQDAAMCRAIGEAGAGCVPPGATIMTHCNAGRLATGGIGTALAVVYVAAEQNKGIDVIACEARPLRQGSRLTAWELTRAGVPTRLVVDSAAAAVMAGGEVDLVVVGADRIAANGDVANKIGTYALAVLARAHDIPFYVAAPRSTFDPGTASGDGIPIELRSAREIETAPGVQVHNPAFDVTPAELITGMVTDAGVLRPPYPDAIRKLFA